MHTVRLVGLSSLHLPIAPVRHHRRPTRPAWGRIWPLQVAYNYNLANILVLVLVFV